VTSAATSSGPSLPTTFDIQGRTVSFPIEVRKARMANAVYSLPADLIEPLVDPAFEVVVDEQGSATVVLGFVDYEDNDLGDYDEVLFSVMAKAGATEGAFIWRLPVNQEFTREAGVRMLGLPKTIERIEIVRDTDSVSCSLHSDGALVLRQTFPELAGVDPVAMPSPTVCLSVVDGTPATSASDVAGGLRMAFDPAGYSLELGDHAWADELRALGLSGAAPSVITLCDDWQATFHAPIPVAGRSAVR